MNEKLSLKAGDHVSYRNGKYVYLIDEVETLSNGVKNYHLLPEVDSKSGKVFGREHWQVGSKLVFVR